MKSKANDLTTMNLNSRTQTVRQRGNGGRRASNRSLYIEALENRRLLSVSPGVEFPAVAVADAVVRSIVVTASTPAGDQNYLHVYGSELDDTVRIEMTGRQVVVHSGNGDTTFSNIDGVLADLYDGDDRLELNRNSPLPLSQIFNVETIAYAGSDNQGELRFVSDRQSPQVNFNPTSISVVVDDPTPIRFDGNWVFEGTFSRDATYYHSLRDGSRYIALNDGLDRNPLNRFDVNNDGSVAPLDVLVIINQLRRNGASGGTTSNGDGIFSDVSGDGVIAPVDVLQVINALSRQSRETTLPEIVDYQSFRGDVVQLYAYEGAHIRLLAESPDLRQKNIHGLIAQIDIGYQAYLNATGRNPSDFRTSVGKTDIARVDTTCGAGCGWLGQRGIEINSAFFDAAVDEFAKSQIPDHIFFYELGRNFWFYQNELEFNVLREDLSKRGSGDFFVNGFPILMERAISEFLDIPYSGAGAGNPGFLASNQRWFTSYLNDPTRNFETDFLDFEKSLYVDPVTGIRLGTMDFFAEVLLDVARDFGELEFLNRLWREIGQRPDIANVNDASRNLIESASIAARVDLRERFANKYKWTFVGASWFDPKLIDDLRTFGGGGLSATYTPGVDKSAPGIRRVDPKVEFEWKLEGPIANFPVDDFLVRWEGDILIPRADTYEFLTFSDDGVRLWIDDELIIDAWMPQRAERSGSKTFSANETGVHRVRLEYFERGGAATVELKWKSAIFNGVIGPQYLRPMNL